MIVKTEDAIGRHVAADGPGRQAAAAAGHEQHRDLAPRVWRKRLLLAGLVVAGIVAVVATIRTLGRDIGSPDEALIPYTVKRGSLPITVTERGNLESQQNEQIICEVDDISGDGIIGTPIVWIIANGSSVKKGDLLVELDSSGHLERLDRQVLDTERARAVQIQAEAKYENQKTQNETTLADAELDVKLAELELEMFTDEENGTHKLDVEAVNRQIEDINNEILAAQANLELKRNEKRGIESLFKLGYAGKSEVDRCRLEFLQAEGQYAAKVNKLRTQLATLAKMKTYEREMEYLRLEGKLQTAQRQLVQVQRNNEAALAQADAALEAANESLKKEEERLQRYREQVEKCKIYAPQDGMVAYDTSSSRYYRVEIREGEPIRPRQKILSLPNLTKMQVKTSVHESVLDQIEPGQKATIRVDAFPDLVYQGTVQSVAVLPEQGSYLSSDTKVYETIVTIDEDVKQLKPGMTAVVEIRVARLENVLTVPIQAVVQIGRDSWCYLVHEGTPERQVVQLGRTNDKFVEVVNGLNEDDPVVLNPMMIIEEAEDEGQPSAAAVESELTELTPKDE
jgi:RND family efflux transporter MFP subunit